MCCEELENATTIKVCGELGGLMFAERLKLFSDGAIFFSEGSYYKVSDKGVMRAQKSARPYWITYDRHIGDLLYYNDSHIYQEVELKSWYDNIPPLGVLCWVNISQTSVDVIREYIPGKSRPYRNQCLHHSYAKPLTYAEVNQFMDNTP